MLLVAGCGTNGNPYPPIGTDAIRGFVLEDGCNTCWLDIEMGDELGSWTARYCGQPMQADTWTV